MRICLACTAIALPCGTQFARLCRADMQPEAAPGRVYGDANE